MITDAGYINNKGEYIEELMYFSFEIPDCEKRKILEEDYREELEKERSRHECYDEYDYSAA